MQIIISTILSIISAILLTLCSMKALQMFQLSSYKTSGYAAWLRRTRLDYFVRCCALAFFCAAAVAVFLLSFPKSYFGYIGTVFYIGLSLFFIAIQKQEKQKTPLKITNRILRQIIILFILYGGISFISVYFFVYSGQGTGEYIGYGAVTLLFLLVPFAPILSHMIALPIEKLIASRYKKKARRVLDSSPIIKIGITGSYGKTTAKNILLGFLSKKYRVLSSPQSHNTPMGLCKLINQGVHGFDIFIAEMGARHTKDIKELCALINPQYGIITSIGNQHLETFGTLDNIMDTKLDLARHAKISVLIKDKSVCQRIDSDVDLSSKLIDNRLNFISEGDIENIQISQDGTSFDLMLNGEKIRLSTSLLGRHIPILMAECALLATQLGISTEEIVDSAKSLQPVEHRLQLIKTKNAIIIDDAFNSNPQGAKNALEVLSEFNNPKVVITPGFIELKNLESESNYNLGAQIARSADYLLCIKNADIIKGAKAHNMDSFRIVDCISLDDATKRLEGLNLVMPTILFLNDLPDNY